MIRVRFGVFVIDSSCDNRPHPLARRCLRFDELRRQR